MLPLGLCRSAPQHWGRAFHAALGLALLFLAAAPARSLESSKLQTLLIGSAGAEGKLRTRFTEDRASLRLRARGLAPDSEHVLLALDDPGDPEGAEIVRFMTRRSGSASVRLDLLGDELGVPVDPRGRYLVVRQGTADVLAGWVFGDLVDDGPRTKTDERTSLAADAAAPPDASVDLRYTSRSGRVSFELRSRGLDTGSHDLFVDGAPVASFEAGSRGSARLRFQSKPCGGGGESSTDQCLALGFDPRRDAVEVRQGAQLLFAGPMLAQLPALGATPSLSVANVETIVAQAVVQAQQLGTPALIAVLDRVGNVLAVWQMPGAPTGVTITSGRGVTTGLENPALQPFPAPLAVISKAGTAAYLSSRGNAFTTRTASQIVQQNFNPKEEGRPGGPLFGVQFSQLPCGDLVRRFTQSPEVMFPMQGPKRLPLGFSADSGALPLYSSGALVGGIGVESNGIYTLDLDIFDSDRSVEERIATAGARGFEAPKEIRAERITVDGRSLRFVDDERADDLPTPASLPGTLIAVPGFAAAEVVAGAPFPTVSSGIVARTQGGLPAEILVGEDGEPLYPPKSSAEPGGLTASEVDTLLTEALRVAERSRAQIRRPLDSKVRVSISVVDTTGVILGFVRSRDAPIFGIDVSLQKARTAALFSRSGAGDDLAAAGFGATVQAFDDFLGRPDALDGAIAFPNRAVGNLARPFFPDGINSRSNGPLSLPFDEWSPFSTGLQLELVAAAVLGGATPCSLVPGIANGIQIFAGSVPIYRAGVLVGAIGISGDGIDQDDMVAFLGLHNAGEVLGTIGNAPRAIRSDRVSARGVQLRYVNCPVKPFLDNNEQDPCGDK